MNIPKGLGGVDISWRLSVTDSLNGRLVIQAVVQRIVESQTNFRYNFNSQQLVQMSRDLLMGALRLEAEAENAANNRENSIGVFDCLVYGHKQAVEKRGKLIEILTHVLNERLHKDSDNTCVSGINQHCLKDKDEDHKDKDLNLIWRCALRVSKLSQKGFSTLMKGIHKIGLEKSQIGLLRFEINRLLRDTDTHLFAEFPNGANSIGAVSDEQINDLLQVSKCLLLVMIANGLLSAQRVKDNININIHEVWKLDIVLESIHKEYGKRSVSKSEWTHFISKSESDTSSSDSNLSIVDVTNYVESIWKEELSTWKTEDEGDIILSTNIKRKRMDDLGKVQILNADLLNSKADHENHIEEKQQLYESDSFASDCDSILEITEKEDIGDSIKRKSTITFAKTAMVFEIPKYTDEEKQECFYTSSEISALLENAEEIGSSYVEEKEPNLNQCQQQEKEMIIGTVSELL